MQLHSHEQGAVTWQSAWPNMQPISLQVWLASLVTWLQLFCHIYVQQQCNNAHSLTTPVDCKLAGTVLCSRVTTGNICHVGGAAAAEQACSAVWPPVGPCCDRFASSLCHANPLANADYGQLQAAQQWPNKHAASAVPPPALLQQRARHFTAPYTDIFDTRVNPKRVAVQTAGGAAAAQRGCSAVRRSAGGGGVTEMYPLS